MTPVAPDSSAPVKERKSFQVMLLFSRALVAEDTGNDTTAIRLYREILSVNPTFTAADSALRKLLRRQ